MTYADDRSWSDSYIPALKQIVGPLLLDEAPLEHDMQQATDLIVFTARDMRIGCRVRRPGYAERYPWDFTLRAKRDNGIPTEQAKIIDGWGDWLVYGHAADDPHPFVERWFVVDLHVLRSCFVRNVYARTQARDAKKNGDGTWFSYFDVRRLPSTLIVASSHLVPR